MMRGHSTESVEPLSKVNYHSANYPTPYGNSQLGNDSGFYPPAKKSGTSKWIKFGIPLAIIVIAAAVVGGIVASRHKGTAAASSSNGSSPTDPSAAASIKNAFGRFATATDSYGLPLYPATVSFLVFD